MSVIILSGKIGSGKSYEAVDQYILPALRRGRKVYCNLELATDNLDHMAALAGVSKDGLNLVVWPHYDFEYLRNNLSVMAKDDHGDLKPSFIDENALVVIDEAQNIYGNKDWSIVPRHFDQWIGHVRHWGIDVVFITQNPKRLYKAIQSLPPVYIWRFKNLGFLGAKKKYSAKAFLEIGYFDCVRTHIRKYKPEIFKCYKSVVNDKVVRDGLKQANVLTSFKAIAFYISLALVGFWLLNHDWFGAPAVAGPETVKSIPAEVASVKVLNSVPGSMDTQDNLPKGPEVPGAAVRTRSIEVLGLIRGEGSPGFVLYRYLDEPDRRYRVLDYEFDRICKCNTFAKIRAGDVVDINL